MRPPLAQALRSVASLVGRRSSRDVARGRPAVVRWRRWKRDDMAPACGLASHVFSWWWRRRRSAVAPAKLR
ncbi:hypothetical protein F511_11645 [Dorcoceras hygrometricum]|uniref:Uncharacterized protein n=1 Tax=Dorcoceras hygrometricum TaxID=472368 RepID=A0A2Z7ARW9_9LAMI|nr:hypothetical protein F511_11645 [Dorcoceras hygrometricum]